MKKLSKRLGALALAIITALTLCLPAMAEKSAENTEVTVLFTHDLHSHLLPSNKDDGGQFGGYARLKTVIDQQKKLYPDAILVDGGDFSMGSLFQTSYATSAIELRMMGAMGYDATTFGNHEFDYLPRGLASMLNAAVNSGDALPAIVNSNYNPPREGEAGYGEDAQLVREAFDNYGVAEYMILERGGVYYAIFGLVGADSDDCAPNSGMVRTDPAQTAQRIVDDANAYCREHYGVSPVVVCLSHSGTSGGEGEDYELAQAVNGIHVIISGHTHTTLREAIEVNGTYIVSAGEYGKNLGVLRLDYDTDGTVSLIDYELIPIDETVAEDPATAALVEKYKSAVEDDYLSKYGVSFDQVLVNNPYPFESVKQVKATQHESPLCNIFADAYKWAVEQATGLTVDMAVTAAGVIRETLPMGDVTVSDVFNAASLGVGTEGELVAVYLTGADLMTVLELDASVQPLMKAAQLFPSGVEFSYNKNRMIFNKVDYAMFRRADGTLEPVVADKLYLVVTGMYAGEMLGSVESTSYGLLSITPRDANGDPIDMERLVDYVVYDANGNPVKEWYAIASYLQRMGGEMDEQYSRTDGRKVVYSSLNPVSLLRNANKFTYILLAVLLVLLLVVVLILRAIVRRVRRGKSGKKRKGYRTYRGK